MKRQSPFRILAELQSRAARPRARGFSLIEVMVASAVFLLIMLAVYQVYMRSLEGHKLGVNQAELIQSTRFAFEEMATRIRSAGFEFDLDGVTGDTPNQSDESIEYMGSTAIMVRANYDFASEAFRGREVDYENTGGGCCPIVTTGNDEIIAFALGKNEGETQPTETLTAYLDLDAPRNGIIDSNGEIAGEETITIPNVALTDFSDPPYVLYQFTWKDPDGSGTPELLRRPLVDNILSLEFEYFDEGGNDLSQDENGNDIGLPDGGPNPANDPDPNSDGRARRETVRMVKINIKGMTPEPDLRYTDEDDTNPATQKHRKFDLIEEVHTFNVGRRGQKDKDIDPPEPVTDVQLCSGQCGMVRVDWSPGPPEDRIASHLVILGECPGGVCNNCYDSPLASFIVVSDLDLTVDPEREYAVFDIEDDPDLVAGTDVCARVIARDSAGTDSEDPSDSDNNTFLDPDTTNDYTTIQDYTRSEAPSNGSSTGYDPADGDWPDAAPDNDSGVEIEDDDSSPHYPRANSISVTFDTPSFVLDRIDNSAADLYNWTTKDNLANNGALVNDVDAGETCHRIELSPDDSNDNLRTLNEELAESADDDEPNIYIFRISGSDDSNWGPGQSDCDILGPNCIDDPRNFMPYAGNLYAVAGASMLGGSTFTFVDGSESSFYTPDDTVTDQYEDRYMSTKLQAVNPPGFDKPVQAVTPGEVYYYRVRVVDNCWSDENLDGVEDSTAGTAEELTAWSTVDDFPDEATWREAAVTISPFYPPLLRRSAAAGERDKPANNTDDSDAVDLTSLGTGSGRVDASAIPGYAIPRFNQGNTYILPEKPTDLYLARANDSVQALLADNAGGVPGLRVIFNSAKRTSPQDSAGAPDVSSESVGFAWYRLMRKPIGGGWTRGTPLTDAQVNWEADDPTAEVVTEFRLNSDGLREYTIDRRSEILDGKNSASENDALYLAQSAEYMYKLFTSQVSDGEYYDPLASADSLPPHVRDDGISPDTTSFSVGSHVMIWPGEAGSATGESFYNEVHEIRVIPTPDTGINASSVDVEVTMDLGFLPGSDEANCADVRSARLLAYDYTNDQWLGSSNWISVPHSSPTDPADCDFTFGQTSIEQALRDYPSRTRFRVELSDVDESLAANGGADWDKHPRGMRVRSGLVGEAGDWELGTTCAPDCSGGNILGDITDTEISTNADDQVLLVDIPIAACNVEDFRLLQIEVVFDPGGTMPNLERATLSGVRAGTQPLPDPEFNGDDGGLHRIRWFEGAFCDMGTDCDFPVVESDESTLRLSLRFDGPVCDPVKLLEFNFRVENDIDAGALGLEELLCSQRGELEPMGDEPDFYCSSTGAATDDCGRGPATDPEPCGQNPGCDPDCEAGRCPVNSNFSLKPSTCLEDNGADQDRIVRITQTEDCSSGCDLDMTSILVRFECDAPDRDCAAIPIANYTSADFIQYDDLGTEISRTPLDPPDIDRVASSHIELEWSGLTDLVVDYSREFAIEILFDDSMVDTKITTYELQFGEPLPSTATCDWAPSDPDEADIDVPHNCN